MKDPNAKGNTHYAEIEGIVYNGAVTIKTNVLCRFTSDQAGETLSFEIGGLLIIAPYEPIIDLIEEARRDRKCKAI